MPDYANHEVDLVNFLFGHSEFDANRLTDNYNRYQVAGIRDDGIDGICTLTLPFQSH